VLRCAQPGTAGLSFSRGRRCNVTYLDSENSVVRRGPYVPMVWHEGSVRGVGSLLSLQRCSEVERLQYSTVKACEYVRSTTSILLYSPTKDP
jgi:hypothetical protein